MAWILTVKKAIAHVLGQFLLIYSERKIYLFNLVQLYLLYDFLADGLIDGPLIIIQILMHYLELINHLWKIQDGFANYLLAHLLSQDDLTEQLS